MSLEEYLKGREACDHCSTTGNQVYCTTNLLSNDRTCLIYNALMLNGKPEDDSKALLLQNFRDNFSQELVIEYYIRSSDIITKVRQNPNFQAEFWSRVADNHVIPIIDDIEANRITQAVMKIHKMLDDLESEV